MAAIAVEAQENAKAAGREMNQVELGLGLGFTPKAYFQGLPAKQEHDVRLSISGMVGLWTETLPYLIASIEIPPDPKP